MTDERRRVAADLRTALRLLVDRPEQVRVEAVDREGGAGAILEVRVAPADVGKIIGREGRTIDALRALVSARSAAEGERYDFELVEP
jgi:predicted RNA-binding protein YlqC (UPF0109 family)